MKAVVAAFNQEKALVGAFSVITNLRMELFEALLHTVRSVGGRGIVIIKLPFYSASSGPCNLITSGQSDRRPLPAMGGQIEISTPVLYTLYIQCILHCMPFIWCPM